MPGTCQELPRLSDRCRHDVLLHAGSVLLALIAVLYTFGCAVPPPGQVATPTLTPNGGTFGAFVDAALSTPTNGATIRFTTDGSDPDASSLIFGAPIHLTETTTLKAQASKDGLADSDVASALFIVPTTTRVSISSDGTQANDATTDAIISVDRGGRIIREFVGYDVKCMPHRTSLFD